MPEASTYDESALLQRLATGDAAAFEQLFYRWHHPLANFLFRLTKDRFITDDIVQDCFLKLWNGRAEAANIKNLGAWLFLIARNYTLNVLRNMTRKGELEKKWAAWQSDTSSDATAPEQYLVYIDEAVNLLSPQRKKVYTLSRKEGLRQQQIADQLGITRETVKKHIMAATAQIAEYVRSKGLPVEAIYILSGTLPLFDTAGVFQ